MKSLVGPGNKAIPQNLTNSKLYNTIPFIFKCFTTNNIPGEGKGEEGEGEGRVRRRNILADM